jgi:hypothetical protein
MHVIRKEEEKDYSLFVDKLAYCTYLHSGKAVKDVAMDVKPEELKGIAEAVGMAVGQVVLDKTIELTNKMDKDTIIRYLAQLAFSHTIEVMNQCPEYRMKIAVLGQFLDKI